MGEVILINALCTDICISYHGPRLGEGTLYIHNYLLLCSCISLSSLAVQNIYHNCSYHTPVH